MNSFIAAGVTILVLIWLTFSSIMVIECNKWWSRTLWAIISFVSWSVALGFLMELTKVEEQEKPCVRYEYQYQYNPAVKSVVPIRACVLRGEWLDKDYLIEDDNS